MENIQELPITETAQEESVSAPVKASKRGRKPKKGTASSQPVITAPPARTPAMDRLEEEILQIVSKRSAANDALRNAKFTAEQAQLQLKNAQEFLFSLEQEVNYRMTLLGQLKGNGAMGTGLGAAILQNPYTPAQPSNPWDSLYAAPAQNNFPSSVSSIPPASPAGIEVVGGRRVRSEGAEAMRAML